METKITIVFQGIRLSVFRSTTHMAGLIHKSALVQKLSTVTIIMTKIIIMKNTIKFGVEVSVFYYQYFIN